MLSWEFKSASTLMMHIKVLEAIPVWAVQGLDCFRVQVLDSLFVATAHTVLGPGISVKRVDGLGDAHLRCRHG